jgi:hypothetical protein
MYLFVLAVWIWNMWLGVMALRAFQMWKEHERGPLFLNGDEPEPVDVNKLD